MSIAKPMEVELTWILLKGLKHFKLLIVGFQILKKLHSRPDQKSVDGNPLCMTIVLILGLQLSWILCLGLVNIRRMRLGF